MKTRVATDAGSPNTPSEDRAAVGPNLIVVVDGATVRTETGCVHGVAWYAEHLVNAIVEHGRAEASDALAAAITATADLHRDTCDLTHPGSPSAAVGIVQIDGGWVRYLSLGDVTVVLDLGSDEIVITDDRVSQTALAERRAADALPTGSAEKTAALIRMKKAELAARNTPDGYWIAASNPLAALHAYTGQMPVTDARQVMVLSDGATRAVEPFGLYTWRELIHHVAANGPEALIADVREVEASDPDGTKWPRNKLSDDATVIYGSLE